MRIHLLALALSLPPVLTDPAAPPPAAELDPAPSGFSWHSIPEIKAHFLLPDGWHFQEVGDLLDLDYALTPEPIESVHEMKMGLRISVLFETERKSGIPAERFGEATADLFEKRGKVHDQTRRQLGPFEVIDQVVEPPTDHCCPARVRIFANTETDTLYWISFTSAPGSWDADWKRFGSRITEGFLLEAAI